MLARNKCPLCIMNYDESIKLWLKMMFILLTENGKAKKKIEGA
jgi:hypothetical protein